MAGEKKVAVAGGTGHLGKRIVEVLEERGHQAVAMSRSNGVDLTTGEGLGAALDGVEVLIDAATSPDPDEKAAAEFFTAASRNLQEAGAERGVGSMFVVSIVGIDHYAAGYYAAKRVQERVALDGPIPVRFLRATQFHEFVGQMLGWSTEDGVARVPPLRTQLIAARSVAETMVDLVEGADGAPVGNPVAEVAGPREESLVEAAKLHVAKNGEDVRIEVGSDPSDPEDIAGAGGLLPGPAAKLVGPTYEEWLAG